MSTAVQRVFYASRKLSWAGKDMTDVAVVGGLTLTLYGASAYHTWLATHFHKNLFYKDGKKIAAAKTPNPEGGERGVRYELNQDEVVIEWRDWRPGSSTRFQKKKLTNKPLRVRDPAACVASLLADYTMGEDDVEELFDLLGVKDDMTVDYDKPSEEYITTILNGYIRTNGQDLANTENEKEGKESLLAKFGHEEGYVVGHAKKFLRGKEGKLELTDEEGRVLEFYVEVADPLDRKFERLMEEKMTLKEDFSDAQNAMLMKLTEMQNKRGPKYMVRVVPVVPKGVSVLELINNWRLITQRRAQSSVELLEDNKNNLTEFLKTARELQYALEAKLEHFNDTMEPESFEDLSESFVDVMQKWISDVEEFEHLKESNFRLWFAQVKNKLTEKGEQISHFLHSGDVTDMMAQPEKRSVEEGMVQLASIKGYTEAVSALEKAMEAEEGENKEKFAELQNSVVEESRKIKALADSDYQRFPVNYEEDGDERVEIRGLAEHDTATVSGDVYYDEEHRELVMKLKPGYMTSGNKIPHGVYMYNTPDLDYFYNEVMAFRENEEYLAGVCFAAGTVTLALSALTFFGKKYVGEEEE